MSPVFADRDYESKPSACCAPSTGRQTESLQNLTRADGHGMKAIVSFSITGMRCFSCVEKIETVLLSHTGVSRVFVDLETRSATIHFDPGTIDPVGLKSAIEAAGYSAAESKKDGENKTNEFHGHAPAQKIGLSSIVGGMAAALGVVGFYFGLLTATSDWSNAVMQFEEYRWWIIALSVGLGVQVTLFLHMKKRLSAGRLKGATSGLVASGGMSTASMAACCAHYLVPLMAAVGLPFLSAAAAGIAEYQTEIFMLGVLSNLFGLGVMLRLMHKNGMLKLGMLPTKKYTFQKGT